MQEFLNHLGGTTSEQVTPNGRNRGPEFDTLDLCACRDITFSRRGSAATTTTGRYTDATVKRPYDDGNPDDD